MRNIEQIQRLALRVVATFAYNAMAVIGSASLVGGIPVVLVRVSRPELRDGVLGDALERHAAPGAALAALGGA